MKKNLIISGILALAIIITACSSASGQGSAVQAGGEAAAQASTTHTVQQTPSPMQAGDFSMPLAMQLVLGTFKLDETDYPVEGAQAEELLTLWKAARSLSESDTTAAEEIEALVNQIRDSLTAEQLQAIEDMNLSFEDMGAIAEQLGLEFGAGRFGDITPEMQATMEARRESGEFPGGGPEGGPMFIPGSEGGAGGGPGRGAGGGFGGEFNPEAMQTAIAERGELRGAGLGLNPALLNAIIDFLQAKVE